MNSKLLIAVAVLISCVLPARADIVSTSGAVKTISPPADVRTGKLESDTIVHLFVEQTGVTSSQSISADITQPGTSPDSSGRRNISPGDIPPGSKINSYYIHYDKVGGGDVIKSAAGSVTFSESILGLIVSKAGLDATNAFPGLPGTMYGGGQVEIKTPDAFITLSADLKTVSFNLVVTTASDNIRVITGISANSENNGITVPGGQLGGQAGNGLTSGLCGIGGSGLGIMTPLLLTSWISARRWRRHRPNTTRGAARA